MSLEELRGNEVNPALVRVLRDDGDADPEHNPELPAELLVRAYREMRRLRLFDARMIALQRQGRIGFYGSAHGQEAVPVATGLVLEPNDWVFPALREQSTMLVRGFPIQTYVAQIFGNSGDILKGRQMPSHMSGRSVHQVSGSSCVASQLPHAVGAAWAMRAQNSGAVSVAFLGDGATSHGDFHAAMNFAGLWRVPCVLVCQNNHWSISVPTERQTATRTLAVKAVAYGVPGTRVDGNDFLALYSVLRDAVGRARAGDGPTFVEAVTYRMGAHSTSDDPSRYRSQREVEEWAERDPIDRLRRHLQRVGCDPSAGETDLEKELSAEIANALAQVEPLAPVACDTMFQDVYAEMPWHLREQLSEATRAVEQRNARKGPVSE